MNIIRSAVVDPSTDVFWGNIPDVGSMKQKPVLVLVTAYASGSAEEMQMGKMLGAAGLAPDQYNVVQLAPGQQVAWHKLREITSPKAVFLVGILPAQLGISSLFQLHAPNRFNDRMWLPTLSLAELEQQPEVKKHLWTNGMKPLFKDNTYNIFG